MRVSILEPTKTVYEGNAKEVVLSSQEGQVTVLDFHQQFLFRLIKSYITIRGIWTGGVNQRSAQTTEINIPINGGVAKMSGNELIIIAEPSLG
ncbi:MAG: hypothetical protein ABIH18_06295 [Candidatus Omnitrophota bacterium]